VESAKEYKGSVVQASSAHGLLAYLAWVQPKYPAVRRLGASTAHGGLQRQRGVVVQPGVAPCFVGVWGVVGCPVVG
jgi:hypothetical protein